MAASCDSDQTLIEDTDVPVQTLRLNKPLPSPPRSTPRLSLHGETHQPGIFQLVVDRERSVLPPSHHTLDVSNGGNDWVGLDLSHTSPKVVDNWMEAPEAISREDQKPLGARSVTTAWAKQSKNGFIIRLRRKLNKTRDAVAEVHLLHNRSTQHKPRQNRVEFVENYLMAFPPPKEHLHSELDSLSFKELEANSDYPPSELPGSRPNSPSELSANTEENSPSFSTHLSSLPLQRGYGTIDERLEAASPYTVSLSQPLSSLLENAPQYSDGVSPVASAHVTSDGPPSESEAGNVRPQTDEDTEAREDQGYMHSSEPQVGDGASSIAIQSRSAADEERPKAQATVDFTRMTQGLVDEDPSCEIGGRTTLVRGLSVTRTKRYETSTDAEPESPSREVAPNRTQDDTQDTSAAPLLPVKDDSGSAHLTVRSPDDFTILGHKPQYLTKDASIEHLWTALLQGQVLILGLENPLVYEAKHQLALSRRVQHQDVGLLRALDDTRENAETTLGRTHPLVGTFNSNLDLLRTAIMEEADGEKGALDLGKNKSLASPREHFSTNSPLEEDIPRPLFHANPLRQKSSSLEAQSSNRVENPQSSAPDRNVDDLDKPNKNPEEDDKNGVSEANLVESPEQDLQANTPSAASEPLDVENSENAAAKSEKTPELPSATNPRGPDNTIATLHDDQSDLNGLVIEKRRSLLGTIEESPGEADELTDSPQVAGISNKPRESLDIFNTINHRTRYASLSRGMNGRHRYLKMRPRTEFQESRGPQYSMLRPPNTKMDGPAIDSKIRLRTEQVNKVYTPSSESVPQKIEDWFNTSRPPHQIRDHRIATLRVSVAASVRVLLNALFWLLRSFGPEAVVPDGKVRVRWTCLCGEQLYDDFVERRPGAARELQAYLNRPRQHPSSSSPSTISSPAASRTFTSNSSQGAPSSATSWSRQSIGNGSSPSGDSWRLGSIHTPSDLRPGTRFTPLQDPPWLLTCASEDRFTPKLDHLNVDSSMILSDKDLANVLRKHYFHVNRKWYRAFLRLRGLTSINFVRFEVHRNRFADIIACPDMPSTNNGYEFEPTDLMPPVGSSYFHHLFMHPEDYDEECIAYARIPRKVGGRLRMGQGWGINLVEDFLPHRVWAMILALLLVSLVFAIVWASLRQDIQGAFGVACYIMALATVAVAWIEACIG